MLNPPSSAFHEHLNDGFDICQPLNEPETKTLAGLGSVAKGRQMSRAPAGVKTRPVPLPLHPVRRSPGIHKARQAWVSSSLMPVKIHSFAAFGRVRVMGMLH